MDNLSEKAAQVVVKYIDLDNSLAELANSGDLSGALGQPIRYSTNKQVSKLKDRGYVLVDNAFDPVGTTPVFKAEPTSYLVTFRHGHEKVTIDHLKYGVKPTDLQTKGTQTVHYAGAGNRTPRDMVSTVTFNRILVYDQVTGQKIGDQGWSVDQRTYPLIGTPTVMGYIPDAAYVGGETVKVDDPNRQYTVNYKINKQPSADPQTAEVKYIDLDRHNQEIIPAVKLTGAANTQISYQTAPTLTKLENAGYELVSNDFDANGDIQFFDNSNQFTQTFIVTLKHQKVVVDIDRPREGIDRSLYEKTVKRVIEFSGAQEKTPKKIVQNSKWLRAAAIDAVTKSVFEKDNDTTAWYPVDEVYPVVKVPIVAGYHADKAQVPAASVAMKDQVEQVQYQLNGRIIAFDQAGEEIAAIPKLRFITAKDDATKVVTPIVLNQVQDYEPEKEQVPVADPGQDIQVTYVLAHKYVAVNAAHPLAGIDAKNYSKTVKAVVHYQGAGEQTPEDSIQVAHWSRTITYDQITKEVVADGKFDTDWQADQIQFKAVKTPVIRGYHADMGVVSAHPVTQNNLSATIVYTANGQIIPVDEAGQELPDVPHLAYITDPDDATRVLATEDVPEFDNYLADEPIINVKDPDANTTVLYHIKPRYVKVDPAHPYAGIDQKEYDYQVENRIHYVGAGEQTPKDSVQVARWQRTLTVNDVDGSIVENGKFNTKWQVDISNFDKVTTPVIDGYHANEAYVPSRQVDREDHRIEITYQKNGAVVPVDIKGNKIPNAPHIPYLTDPSNPTKVLTEQTVPRLMGYMPKQPLVNVDQAGEDIQLTYYALDQVKELDKTDSQELGRAKHNANVLAIPIGGKKRTAIVNFVDLDHNAHQIASSNILSGDVGQKINDLYSTKEVLQRFKDQGYELVYNGFDSNGAIKYFDEQQKSIKIFTVAMKRGHDFVKVDDKLKVVAGKNQQMPQGFIDQSLEAIKINDQPQKDKQAPKSANKQADNAKQRHPRMKRTELNKDKDQSNSLKNLFKWIKGQKF